jgi:hypothetical protein
MILTPSRGFAEWVQDPLPIPPPNRVNSNSTAVRQQTYPLPVSAGVGRDFRGQPGATLRRRVVAQARP